MQYLYKNPYTFDEINLAQIKEGQEGIFLRNQNQSFTVKDPLFIKDPDQTGIFSQFSTYTSEYKQPFLISLKDVEMIGVRTFLKGNYWFNDQSYLNEEEFLGDVANLNHVENEYLNEYTRFKPTSEKTVFTKELKDRPEVILKGTTLVLCAQEPDVFGSWISRQIPKMYAASLLDIQYDQILIEPHPRLLEYCDLIGLDKYKIVKHHRYFSYKLEKALIPSLQNAQFYLDQQSLQFYHDLRNKYREPNVKKKNYFISRLNHNKIVKNYRRMLNEELVVEALKEIDFEIIYPELLNVKEQVKLFSSANIIVGPSGSALFNCVYCMPNTVIIDMESQKFHLKNHASLFSSFGVNYGFLAGKVDPQDKRDVHQNWSINLDALLQEINSHLSSY